MHHLAVLHHFIEKLLARHLTQQTGNPLYSKDNFISFTTTAQLLFFKHYEAKNFSRPNLAATKKIDSKHSLILTDSEFIGLAFITTTRFVGLKRLLCFFLFVLLQENHLKNANCFNYY